MSINRIDRVRKLDIIVVITPGEECRGRSFIFLFWFWLRNVIIDNPTSRNTTHTNGPGCILILNKDTNRCNTGHPTFKTLTCRLGSSKTPDVAQVITTRKHISITFCWQCICQQVRCRSDGTILKHIPVASLGEGGCRQGRCSRQRRTLTEHCSI